MIGAKRRWLAAITPDPTPLSGIVALTANIVEVPYFKVDDAT